MAIKNVAKAVVNPMGEEQSPAEESLSQVAAGGEEAGKSGVKKAEGTQKVTISFDRTNEQVLQFNQDRGMELVWDEDSFRELPDTVEAQLSHRNLKNYLQVQFKVKERAQRLMGHVAVVNPIDPLGMNSDFRLRIRERKGWHQCWKSPGLELEAALAGPYKQVRKLKETKERDRYGEVILEKVEPGYENGEVLKLNDENNKVELVAVECPLDLYKEYVEYLAKKSRSMYDANMSRFTENVEELNKPLDKAHRLEVIGGNQ